MFHSQSASLAADTARPNRSWVSSRASSAISRLFDSRLPTYLERERGLMEAMRRGALEHYAIEKRYIRKALRRTRGNVMRTAKICGLSRRSISAMFLSRCMSFRSDSWRRR